MSELGQNEGQEQGKDAPFFDSSKITDKKDVEHFANVEGAEERARKAEQAKKAAEKEAQEVHAADIRAASEQLKKQENAETPRKRGGVIGFLFGGWHKIVTIVVLLLVVLGCIFIPSMLKDNAEKMRLENDEKMQVEALDVYRSVSEIQENESLDAAQAKMEEEIKRASDEKKIYLLIYYAEFLAVKTGDLDSASDKLAEAKGYCNNEKERQDVKNAYSNIGMMLGDNNFIDRYDSVEEK